MSKVIPIQMLQCLKGIGRDTCYLIKVKSQINQQVFPFTTGDFAIRFDDGEDYVWYMPTNVLKPQNMQWSSDMSVDNTELHGWFDDVVSQAVSAGLFGDAEVSIYRINMFKPDAGYELVNFGVVGRVEFTATKNSSHKIEFKGLDHLLKTKRNPLYSITCRNDFGDERCGKPLIWTPAVVDDISNQFLWFKVDGIVQPDNYYGFGVVRFDTGDNAGAELEIETWSAEGWLRLSFVTPYPVQAGDVVSVRQDCNKFPVTCKTVYTNMIRYNGEHLTPVQDQSLMVPGAYIKTNNAL